MVILQTDYVAGSPEIQQVVGVSVLVLSNWSQGIVQNVHLQHNYGYVLRVTAKKRRAWKRGCHIYRL
ncbi:hypothetical protein [Bacillus wiedmannii]|uniref:hypothetical protein n=1 Tax=Bacillus wiedmannii TaxID=1890302 RepID=UPI00355B93A7